MKAVLRGKFTALNASIRKEERSNLSFHLRKLEKEEQITPSLSRRKEIRIRIEINEIENKISVEKINETKSWSFEKILKLLSLSPG